MYVVLQIAPPEAEYGLALEAVDSGVGFAGRRKRRKAPTPGFMRARAGARVTGRRHAKQGDPARPIIHRVPTTRTLLCRLFRFPLAPLHLVDVLTLLFVPAPVRREQEGRDCRVLSLIVKDRAASFG
jgi:hypothetical protein